jgi:hypothetical protein
MYSLKYDKEAQAEIYQKLGGQNGHNVAPLGWREISTKELIQNTNYNTYSPKGIETRQILRDQQGNPVQKNEHGTPTMLSARLYHFFDGTGVAFVTDYWNKPHLRYFAFGCKHEWGADTDQDLKERGIRLGRCEHAIKCTKCGHFQVYDSSD